MRAFALFSEAPNFAATPRLPPARLSWLRWDGNVVQVSQPDVLPPPAAHLGLKANCRAPSFHEECSSCGNEKWTECGQRLAITRTPCSHDPATGCGWPPAAARRSAMRCTRRRALGKRSFKSASVVSRRNNFVRQTGTSVCLLIRVVLVEAVLTEVFLLVFRLWFGLYLCGCPCLTLYGGFWFGVRWPGKSKRRPKNVEHNGCTKFLSQPICSSSKHAAVTE